MAADRRLRLPRARRADELTFGDRADVDLFWHTPYLAFLLPWLGADLAFVGIFVWAWWRAEQARFELRYLSPLAFRTLMALCEVLIDGRHEAVPPRRVAENVDGYLAELRASGRSRVQLAFTALAVWPLLTLRLPFPAMTPEARRRYLERRFLVDVAERRIAAPLRVLVQAMIRVASQMAYLGYYGDRAAWKSVGCTPFVVRRGGREPRPDEHFSNMRRYRHMACAGVLVGTTRPGSVRPRRGGPEITYTPSRSDLARVVDGLQLLGRAYLAAGARRVMPATFKFHAFGNAGQLAELRSYVRDNADLLLTTAHPQGGNPVGTRHQGGVVDERFGVHELDNLYLCDASAFPSSVTVNPQSTVMGMAWPSASRIAGRDLSPTALITAAPGNGASSPAAYPRASGRAGA